MHGERRMRTSVFITEKKQRIIVRGEAALGCPDSLICTVVKSPTRRRSEHSSRFKRMPKIGRNCKVFPVHDAGRQSEIGKGLGRELTLVKRRASIRHGATILPSLVIGEKALVAVGSGVTRDVPADAIVAGNLARVQRFLAPIPKATK
jgi:acetyltransferase-like isoleucine patch superfamily enzyme